MDNFNGEIDKKDILFRECFVFVLDLIQFTELLEKKKKMSLAKQIFNAGTVFGEINNSASFSKSMDKYFEEMQELLDAANRIKYLLQLSMYSYNYPKPHVLVSDLTKIMEMITQQISI